MVLILFFISLFITLVWDVLMFPTEIASGIASLLTKGKIRTVTLVKPFGCSICMTFWVGLIYVLITVGFGTLSTFITNLCLCLAFAFGTTYIQMTINLINKLIINLFVRLEKLIDKI